MSESRPHYAWVILVVGTLVVCAALGLARFGYSIVLPAMQEGLAMDNTEAGVLATANLVGYLALSVIGGALASHYGPRAVIAVGLTVVAASMALTGLSDTVVAAAFWRAVTGVGSGASNVPVMGLLAAWFAVRRRGLATGVAVAGSSLALIALGPTVPEVLQRFGEDGWRVCWYGFAALSMVIALLGYLLLRDSPAQVGLRPLGASGEVPAEAQVAAANRLRWGDVYRSGAVWHLGLVYVAFGFSYIIYLTFFVKALIADGGYTPGAAGGLFMIMGWCSLLCGVIWGAVSDAIGRRAALVIVYLVHATAFGLFALWPQPVGFTISAVLFGLSAWSIPAIMAAACGDMLGARMAPAALGFITLFFGIGQALGPTVGGAMADATGSLLPAMLVAAAVALCGAIAAAFLRETVPCELPE